MSVLVCQECGERVDREDLQDHIDDTGHTDFKLRPK